MEIRKDPLQHMGCTMYDSRRFKKNFTLWTVFEMVRFGARKRRLRVYRRYKKKPMRIRVEGPNQPPSQGSSPRPREPGNEVGALLAWYQ